MGKRTSAVEEMGLITDFYKNKSVFITGHTGFKGAWLVRILQNMGARITGYALSPESGCAYEVLCSHAKINSICGDIRDFQKLYASFCEVNPSVVFHLAAQPLVIDAHHHPAYTFETNLMGTVNLLECLRLTNFVQTAVIVTTDKVYRDNIEVGAYREDDILGGSEPYSASKASVELAVCAYVESFLNKAGIPVSTVRAGNAIGGGDIALNRIVPDCVRSAKKNIPIKVRNPNSVRPYQHVIEPLCAYLFLAKRQCADKGLAGCYNIGPDSGSCITTAALVDLFCAEWGSGQTWENVGSAYMPRETKFLKLDSSKIAASLGWRPVWDVHKAIKNVVEWEKSADKPTVSDRQIEGYIQEAAAWMR